VLYRKGLYDTALKYMREAVAKDGESFGLNAAIRKYHLAMVYQKLGDRQNSSRAMSAALKIDPNLLEAKLVN